MERKPEVYYLRNKEGKLVPVPSFTLEEFAELHDIKEGLRKPEIPPNHSVSKLSLEGEVDGDAAKLEAKLVIELHTDSWARVPLGFRQAVLTSAALSSPKDSILKFDSEADGYEVWLHGESKKSHTLTLNLQVPVTRLGSESNLHFSVPEAATSSTMRLRAPGADLTAQSLEGVGVSTKRLNGETSEIATTGMHGDFWLRWKPAGLPDIKGKGRVEASGVVHYSIESIGRIVASVRFELRGRSGAVRQIRLKLPAGLVLDSDSVVGCSISDERETNGRDNPSNVVTAEFDSPLVAGTQRVVQFDAAWTIDAKTQQRASSRQGISLAGFAVQGALPQLGQFVVSANEGLELLPGRVRNLARTDELPPGIDRSRIRLAYRYVGENNSVQLRISFRETPTRISPKHVVRVTESELRLTSNLTYLSRKTNLGFCEIHLPNWNVEQVRLVGESQSQELDFQHGQNEQLRIILPEQLPARFSLEIKAVRRIAEDDESVSIVVPRLAAGEVVDPIQIVQPATNIRLTPDVDSSTGLIAADSDTSFSEPGDNESELRYLLAPGSEDAVFVSGLEVMPARFIVKSNANVQVESDLVGVHQSFEFDVRHQTRSAVRFQLPRWLLDSGVLSSSLDGEVLDNSKLQLSSMDGDTGQLTIPFATPRSGFFRIDFNYQIKLSELEASRRTPLTIGLAECVDAVELDGAWTARIRPEEQVIVELDDEGWTQQEAADSENAASNVRLLQAETPRQTLRLTTTLVEGASVQQSVLQEYRLQSWLTDNARQDRLLLRVATTKGELTVGLPDQVEAETCLLVVNGVSTVPKLQDTGLSIPLEDVNDGSGGGDVPTYSIEIAYRTATRQSRTGGRSLTPPIVEDIRWASRAIWQVFTPKNEFVVAHPSNMTRLGEVRAGSLGQGFAEGKPGFPSRETSGTSLQIDEQLGGPALVANEHTYLSLDAPVPIQIYTIHREFALFCVAGLTLVLGIAVFRLPALRKRETVFVLAVLALLMIAVLPKLSFVLVQAVIIGLILIGLSRLLGWYLSGIDADGVQDSVQRYRRLLRETVHAALEPGSVQSTATTPIHQMLGDKANKGVE